MSNWSPNPALQQTAAAIEQILRSVPFHRTEPDPAVAIAHKPPDLVWTNHVFAAPQFRRAHLERFHLPGRFTILHLCGLPHLHDPAPILGFDVVASAQLVSGVFLDLSPVDPARGPAAWADPADLAALPGRRARPEWGDIFSDDFLALRPETPQQLDRVLRLAEATLVNWLDQLTGDPTARPDPAIQAGQNRYAAAQRRNQHTFRMLSGFIGAAAARRFIDEALFPLISLPD